MERPVISGDLIPIIPIRHRGHLRPAMDGWLYLHFEECNCFILKFYHASSDQQRLTPSSRGMSSLAGEVVNMKAAGGADVRAVELEEGMRSSVGLSSPRVHVHKYVRRAVLHII